MHVCLLDHRDQGLFNGPTRFEERRKVGAGPQLRNAQFDVVGTGLPVAVSIARGGSVCLNSLVGLMSGSTAGFRPLREAAG